MKQLIAQAAAVDVFFSSRGWRACIIGGVASLRWGEPRLTHDVYATVFTGFGEEESYITAILTEFKPRIADAEAFARINRVVLAEAPGGIGIDIALGGLPFENDMVARSTREEMAPGVFIRVIEANDLIVLKAFAARDRDWADIAGIVVRQGRSLNWNAIVTRLKPLADLKEAPEILERLAQVRRAAEE